MCSLLTALGLHIHLFSGATGVPRKCFRISWNLLVPHHMPLLMAMALATYSGLLSRSLEPPRDASVHCTKSASPTEVFSHLLEPSGGGACVLDAVRSAACDDTCVDISLR